MYSLIDLDIPELGYTRFISSWLYSGPDMAFLVDVGPACTADVLLETLERKGVQTLDWILLTHIHLDHAGGIGHVARQFPEARIVCHPKAVRHLADPSKLWDGTRKVLGGIADIYGPMLPVDPSRILTPEEMAPDAGISIIDTPGHAAHHQSYVFEDRLFIGELFGVFHDLDGDIYLRPATPPKFIYEHFAASLDRVAPAASRKVCFAHHGIYPDGEKILGLAKSQLSLWLEVVGAHLENPRMEAIVDDLKKQDPVFARIDDLPRIYRDREAYYVKNTIRGMLGYLQGA
ncbi:MAG: MBL fold metallo-hydrolase [Desulfosalsimonas sp.]